MAHQSENCKPLRFEKLSINSPEDLAKIDASKPAVWLFILPYGPLESASPNLKEWNAAFKSYITNCNEQTTICVLTSPEFAANFWPMVEHYLHFQLWITVKLKEADQEPGQLPRHHAALLILTKYHRSLEHTRTRIAYTYCPYCDKTTKDYGGKKHTYHELGTLMSDVWRDISCEPSTYPAEVIRRLRDLFGLELYDTLYSVDLRKTIALSSVSCPSQRGHRKNVRKAKKLEYGHTLLNGDCIKLLKEVPSNTVDFCFADPPYNLKKKYDNWDDALEAKEYFEWCDKWLGELARVLKPGRTLAVLNIPLWVIRHFAYLRTVMNFQNWIVWEALGLPARMIMPANYAILCFSKGRPRPLPGMNYEEISPLDKKELYSLKEFFCIRANCIRERDLFGVSDKTPITDLWWDIHRLKHNSRRADHPCQLPPALMRRLIALFAHPKECVLDPFNGVGTTTLVTEQLGCFFIGIELSSVYHQIAVRRHLELRRGLDPFRKRAATPSAKNSPVPRLQKQRYVVSKKELQLEVKRISNKIGKLPNREEVRRLSKYPISYYYEYFVSWGEVCAAARTTGMSEVRNHRNATSKSDNQYSLF